MKKGFQDDRSQRAREARERVLDSFDRAQKAADAEAKRLIGGELEWEDATPAGRQTVMNAAALENKLDDARPFPWVPVGAFLAGMAAGFGIRLLRRGR